MTLNLITGEKSIMAAAKAVNKDGAKMADKIHIVLCSALSHAKQHGNTTIIDHVVSAVHSSANIVGVDAFIRRFTNLQKRPDPKTKTVAYRKPKAEALRVDMDDAVKHPYWALPEVVAANKPQIIDVELNIVSFYARMEKKRLAGEVKNPDKAKAVISKLAADIKSLGLELPTIEAPKPEPKAKTAKARKGKAKPDARDQAAAEVSEAA